MSGFKFESLPPFLGSEVKGEAIGIVATYIDDNPQRQPKEFVLSVGHSFVTVEALRNDGVMIYARLYFDGERFTLGEQGVAQKLSSV